jgi:hypothetical protein
MMLKVILALLTGRILDYRLLQSFTPNASANKPTN